MSLVPKNLRPSILTVFYVFHAMFFGWLLMLLVAIIGVVLRLRDRLYTARWFHKLLVVMIPIGMIAIWGVWVTAETGRQPWIVNGKLLTAAAVSPLKPWSVLSSLILFVLIYLTLLGTYAWYVARAVRQGPGDGPLAAPSPPRSAPALEPSPGIAPAA
jgi:cytochrome bd ubiquinol oxidase subunit I